MSGTGTIYFVRHGECRANVEEMNLPHEIDLLTDKGRQQSSLLGKHLEDIVFTRAYASTYSRAEGTAQEVLAQSKGPKPELQLDERIREREMGDFENRPMGHLFNALFTAAKEKGTKLLEFEIPNGESVQNLENRLGSFLEDLLKTIRESKEHQKVLVVSHGVVIMRMMVKLRIWSKEPSRALTLNSFSLKHVSIPAKNTAYHVLNVKTVQEDGSSERTVIDIEKLHEIEHLASLKSIPKWSEELEELTKNWMETVNNQCATM